MGKTELEKMIAGEFYRPGDEQLSAMRRHARKMTRVYNETDVEESDTRQAIIKDLFGLNWNNKLHYFPIPFI